MCLTFQNSSMSIFFSKSLPTNRPAARGPPEPSATPGPALSTRRLRMQPTHQSVSKSPGSSGTSIPPSAGQHYPGPSPIHPEEGTRPGTNKALQPAGRTRPLISTLTPAPWPPGPGTPTYRLTPTKSLRYNVEKTVSSTSYVYKLRLEHYLTAYIKTNWQWIEDLKP